MSETKSIEHALLHAMLPASNEGDALIAADTVKLHWLTCDSTRAIIGIIKDAGTTDLATIFAAAEGHSAFRTESAKSFAAHIAEKSYGSIRRADDYIRQISDAYQTRQRIEVGQLIAKHADDRDKCAQLIATIEESVTTASINHIADGVLDRLEQRESGEVMETIPIHLPAVNDRAPVRKGHVTVVAAATGNGKTTFALHAAKHAAEQDHGALIVSLEMRRAELADRVLANESKVALDKIQNFDASLAIDERQNILDAVNHVDSIPLHVVDTFQSTPAGVAAQCRKHMRQQPFELLVVDYLQLLNPNKPSGNRAVDVASCSRAMKTLANELDIAVILVSQFNRTAKDELPQLWHLKESSSIEQDASLILMLHAGDRSDAMEVIIRKQRHGESNFIIESTFHRATCRFLPAAPTWMSDRYDELEAFSGANT